MAKPFQFFPSEGFWSIVAERQIANEGHRRNIYEHGPFVGTIGEIAFEEWFTATFPNRPIEHIGETWHDYVVETKAADSGRAKPPHLDSPKWLPPINPHDKLFVEIKTKLRGKFPLDRDYIAKWEVSVPDYLLTHLERTPKPDVYFALSVQSKSSSPTTREEIDSIVILGIIAHGTFQNWKVWIPKGTIMGGGRESEEDMWNVFIRQLSNASGI